MTVLMEGAFCLRRFQWLDPSPPDLGVQVVVSQRVHWLSVQQDQPLLWLVEVFQQTHAGALPAT